MLASIFSLNVLQTALELGCIYGLVALALFLSYSILNIADLSTDGCFTLGCAVACQVALTGHPILALAAAMAAGVCSGFVTAFLQTRLGVESIMAGIIVNTGLYTINLAVMGFSSTMSLVKTDTVFSMAKSALAFTGGWYKLVIAAAVIVLACAAMVGFLGTRLGLSIRATGDNAAMVRASSINPAFTITVGLCISGALTALSGGLLAQYQKSSDINVGTGMVTIALASLIIGETLVGKRTMVRRVLGVVFGIAFVVCAKCTQWCVYAYRSFSYDGERKLSKQIIDGTAKHITLPEGGVGLDIGCGSGALTIACAKRNPQGKMVGIDRWGKEYASFSLPLCEKNAAAEGVKNASFQRGNAVKLDFPDESFDAVTSNYVYHNIAGKDKQALLLETLRVLKKGGTFAIHDLMSPGRYGDMQAFVQKLRDMGYERVELIDTTDGSFMTPKEAKRLMLRGSTLLLGRK